MSVLAQFHRNAFRLAAVVVLLLATSLGAHAQCTLVNTDFEGGTLTGWTNYFRSSGTGQFYNYTGTSTPLSLHSISAPPQGSRAAVSDQSAATTHAFYQDATIPAGTFATLSFYLYWNNNHTSFVTLNTLDYTNNQQFRVDLIKTTTADIESVAPADVIAKLFQTKNGDPLFLTPTIYTYNLSGFNGQTVRLRFAEAVGINYFPVGLDNICLSNTAMVNTRNTSVGSNVVHNFGSVEVIFPSVTVAGTTTVQALNPALNTGPPVGETFIGPSYDISTTSTHSALTTVCLSLPEINNDTTFNNLRLLHKEAGIWVDVANSRKSIVGRQLCGDVPSLSPFAVGHRPALPTAAPTTVAGRITTTEGTPLEGVVMQLNGSQGKQTMTAADGSYSFTVDTGELVTVTPARGNYSFSPHERAITAVGNVANAGFTAVPDQVPTVNPLDTDLFFVRQQYVDFLGREPEPNGLEYWTNEIGRCGADNLCRRQRRIDVSAAFFASDEFQKTGSFIYRLYDAGLGRRLSYSEFVADRMEVVAGENLTQSRSEFAVRFVKRDEFLQRYAGSVTAEAFVDQLLTTMRDNSGIDPGALRSQLLEEYRKGSSIDESRALTLSSAIEQRAFNDAVYNPSFVQMQYFGYLRRGEDEGGYLFWLNVLNHEPSVNFRGMVCSFLTAAEYQHRFSPVVTHQNSECGL